MTYTELAALSGRFNNTIKNRVTRNKMGRREACIYEVIPDKYSRKVNRRERSPLHRTAKKYGIAYTTLSSASNRNPGKHIEVLAQEIKERQARKRR